MQLLRRLAVVLVVCSGFVAAGGAQFGRMGKGMGQAPDIPGLFKPVVGTGAQYQVTRKGERESWAIAVVGKETIGGNDGYWLEMRTEGGMAGGMIMKSLTVARDGQTEVKRMIMQATGQPPMEFPVAMMGMMQQGPRQAAKEQVLGEKIGTETVTVPAGTFTCDHYRSK